MEDEVSEGFKNWEQEQVLSSKESSKEWPMVVIRHSLLHDCSVFPPTNHEGLHISQHTHQTPQSTPSSLSLSWRSPSQCSSSSSSSSSQLDQIEDDPESFSQLDETGDDPEEPFSQLDETGDDDPEPIAPPDSRIRFPSDITGWLTIGLEVLRAKVLCIASKFRNYAVVRGPVWSLGSAAAIVMAVLVSLLYRSVQRRRFREERINQLSNLLKERDERIIQLLQQIAKMNEVLLARHRVP